MAKKNSKKSSSRPGFRQGVQYGFRTTRERYWQRKRKRVISHRSFQRSYREDYTREVPLPGLLHHAFTTFGMFFKNWRTFIPLLIIAIIISVLLVGLMSESTYVEFQNTLSDTQENLGIEAIGTVAKASLLLLSTIATGGLASGSDASQPILTGLIFLILWLVTIFLARQYLAHHKPKLRDALYNACAPLLSTLCVLLVITLQLIPVFIVIITYSAAVTSDFLSTPFYALLYFIFAGLLLLLSGYLLSSSLMALTAVSAPGMYPMTALRAASDLMQGLRLKFFIRLIYLAIVLAIIWVVIMIPVIMLDLWLKSCFDWLSGVPFIPICLAIMTCFTLIYTTLYLYLFYRRILYAPDPKRAD